MSSDPALPRLPRRPRRRRDDAPTFLRCRLEVVAGTVAGVVSAAGGLVCDRAMAGWEVRVHLAGDEDLRPLRILGADVTAVEPGSAFLGDRSPTSTLVLAADLSAVDVGAYQETIATARCKYDDVLLWGASPEALSDDPMTSIEHRMSLAALAFKREALRAAAAPVAVKRVEWFRRVR
jgi:hypothetical protein